MVVAVVWDVAAATVSVPGYSLIASAERNLSQVALYHRVAGAAEATSVDITLSQAASGSAYYLEYSGTLSASPVDRSASATGSGRLAQATTLPVRQSSEVAVGLISASAPGSRFTFQHDSTTGFTEIARGVSSGGTYSCLSEQFTSTMTPVVDQATMSEDADWAAAVVTLYAATPTSTVKFPYLGEFEAITGYCENSPYHPAPFEATVPKRDPLAREIRVGTTAIEVYLPAEVDHESTVFQQYIIRSCVETVEESGTFYHIKGEDLRGLISNHPTSNTVIAVARGTVVNTSVENWVRAYVEAAAITGEVQPGTGIRPIPGLKLEPTSGNRGTVYTDAPAQQGASLEKTISQLLETDRLGWRLRLENPGTADGQLQFQVFSGADHTLGGTAPVVFKVSWDTAVSMQHGKDSIGAVTALSARARDDGTGNRPTYYVEDLEAIQKYGYICGEKDISNELYPSRAVAYGYLKSMLPHEFVQVVPLETAEQRYFKHYQMLDRVTALTAEGLRFDSEITQARLDFSRPEDGINLGEFQGPVSEAAPPVARWENFIPGLTIYLGNPPGPLATEETKDSTAAALRELPPFSYNPRMHEIAPPTSLGTYGITIASSVDTAANVYDVLGFRDQVYSYVDAQVKSILQTVISTLQGAGITG